MIGPNKTQVASMPAHEFVDRAWILLTNRHDCGGVSKGGRSLARARARSLGMKFFVAFHCDDDGNGWKSMGLTIDPVSKLEKRQGVYLLFTGNSVDECIHKLGCGCAKLGWEVWRDHA